MLPFLPTLATALVIAAASLFCRSPSQPDAPPPATVVAARAGADGFHPARDPASHSLVPALAAADLVPAALAFGRLHPPAFVTGDAAKPAMPAVRPARVAAQAAMPPAAFRRPCSGVAALPASRCVEAAHRGETLHASVPHPARTAPELIPVADAARPLPAAPDTAEQDEGLLPKDALPYASTAASWIDGVGRFGVRVGGSVGREAVAVGGSVVELLASAR